MVVSGRSQESSQAAAETLVGAFLTERVAAHPCDACEPEQLQRLWDHAVEQFGHVDIWINNAGISGPQVMMWDYTPEQARCVIETNLLGTVYGAKIAIEGMLAQGFGAIYNLEGMGSGGRIQPGLALYGTSKAAITYLTQALAEELEDTHVLVASLRPGMVITDLVMQHYQDNPEAFERVRGIFSIIADRVETVTPWLVEKILANDKSGRVISWYSPWKLAWRFLSAPFTKRNVFDV